MKTVSIIFILGAFASLSMAPNNFWPALFLGLSSLYLYIDKANTPLRAGIYGMIFSLGYFGFSLSWIGNALLVEDNPYWWAWPLAVTGLPLILSLFTFTFCALHKKLNTNRSPSIKFLSFTLALTITDIARGYLFTGFPWNLYGYTWIDTPIAQVAGLWNIYLLNSLTILWALTPAYIIRKNHSRTSRIAIGSTSTLLLITSLTYGIYALQKDYVEDHNINSFTIVQPNIKQSEKWKETL